MRTIYHPNLPVSQEVPDGDLEAWKDQGWRVTDPAKKANDSTAAATAADKGQHPEKE